MLEINKADVPDAEPDVGLRVVSLEQKVDFLYKVLAFVIEGVDERGSATSWFFDARYPSDCSNLYEAEYSDKNVKRWVGPAPQLVFRPSLKADTDYVLTTSIMDFITPEAEKDFRHRRQRRSTESRPERTHEFQRSVPHLAGRPPGCHAVFERVEITARVEHIGRQALDILLYFLDFHRKVA